MESMCAGTFCSSFSGGRTAGEAGNQGITKFRGAFRDQVEKSEERVLHAGLVAFTSFYLAEIRLLFGSMIGTRRGFNQSSRRRVVDTHESQGWLGGRRCGAHWREAGWGRPCVAQTGCARLAGGDGRVVQIRCAKLAGESGAKSAVWCRLVARGWLGGTAVWCRFGAQGWLGRVVQSRRCGADWLREAGGHHTTKLERMLPQTSRFGLGHCQKGVRRPRRQNYSRQRAECQNIAGKKLVKRKRRRDAFGFDGLCDEL